MDLIKPKSHVDYQETFVFASQDELDEAEKRAKGAGLGYVVPVVEDGPEFMLQVKGDQAAKRMLKVLRRRFTIGEPCLIVGSVAPTKVVIGKAWGCRRIQDCA